MHFRYFFSEKIGNRLTCWILNLCDLFLFESINSRKVFTRLNSQCTNNIENYTDWVWLAWVCVVSKISYSGRRNKAIWQVAMLSIIYIWTTFRKFKLFVTEIFTVPFINREHSFSGYLFTFQMFTNAMILNKHLSSAISKSLYMVCIFYFIVNCNFNYFKYCHFVRSLHYIFSSVTIWKYKDLIFLSKNFSFLHVLMI